MATPVWGPSGKGCKSATKTPSPTLSGAADSSQSRSGSQSRRRQRGKRPRPQVAIASRLPRLTPRVGLCNLRPQAQGCPGLRPRPKVVGAATQARSCESGRRGTAYKTCTKLLRRRTTTTISGSFGSPVCCNTTSLPTAGRAIKSILTDPRGWVAARLVISPSPSSVSMA